MRSVVVGALVRGSLSGASGAMAVVSAGLAVVTLLLAAPQANAQTSALENGSISIQVNVLDPIVLPQSPQSVVPTSLSRVNNELTAIAFQENLFATAGFVVPVTDPGAFPIAGLQATAMNAAAAFETAAGVLGGQMGLIGTNKVCLFGACSTAVSNLNVPLDPVGVGGPAFATGAVNLTVVGAPWTAGTAAIGTVTRMGGTAAATQNGGATIANDVTLVTPVFVSTNIGASAVVPVWGTLNFTVTTSSPEPGTIAGLGAAIAALTAMGLARRKG